MQSGFEILPHTSEIRLKVIGEDYRELFETALSGLNHLLKKKIYPGKKSQISERLIISSADYSMLLIDFLSQVLTLCHTK